MLSNPTKPGWAYNGVPPIINGFHKGKKSDIPTDCFTISALGK
jgi:hypothetical protein